MKENKIIVEPDSLLLSGDKTFFTLQGEGETIGKPAVFMRLHMCNLGCSWCDTKYTWDKTKSEYFSEPQRYPFDKVLKKIRTYPARRLVITGGEPMLHVKPLTEFIKLIPDWDIEIETNGTIMPSEELLAKVRFNVSPKLENSGNIKPLRYRPNVLSELNKYDKTSFKFVVVGPKDLFEIDKIIEECKLDNDKIILMPEGVTQEAIAQHGGLVADICKRKGWRLVPRLQVMLWGSKRGK